MKEPKHIFSKDSVGDSTYPSNASICYIVHFNDYEQFDKLFDFIERVWWAADWGFIRKKRGIFYLHTGGWSGNEEIILAMARNRMFWTFCWIESKRGGHYKFQIPKNCRKHN